MPTIGDVFLGMKADDRQFRTDLTKKASKHGDEAGKKAGSRFSQSMRDTISKNANLIAASAGAALGVFVTDSARQFAQFETSMNEVFTLLPGISQSAMDDMEQQVKDFSNEFGRLPEEVVPALYQSLSAGVDQDNVFAFLETANKLAVGGVAETSEAVSVLAAVTKGYNDTSEEAVQRTSDLLFNTVKLGTTTIPELSAAIGKAVPQAAALNVSQEELLATTAALTGVTGNTAEVSTQMKAIFTALLKPGADLKRGLEAIGFESGEAAIETLGLQGTLDALMEQTGGNTEEFARMLRSSEALTAGLAIVGPRAQAVEDNLEEMQNATGATEEAFQQMDQGVQATANRIAARINTLMIGVGEAIAPVAPLLVAFGPTIGRALGGAFGAGFGLLVKNIPRLMGPVIAKIGAVVAASSFGQNLLNGLAQPGFLGKLRALGGGWGRMLGIGVVAVLGVIILKQLEELNRIIEQNARQAAQIEASTEAQALFEAGVTRAEAEAQLENLRNVNDELDGIQQGIKSIGDLGEGNILGSGFDILFGDNPAETANTAIRGLEEYLASDLPERVRPSFEAAGESMGEGMAAGVSDGVAEGLPDEVQQTIADLEAAGVISTFEDIGEDAGTGIVEGMTEPLREIGPSIRSALKESFPTVKDAMRDLTFAMTNPMKVVKRIARVEALLTGKKLTEGLASSDPIVKRAAENTQAILIGQWEELTGQTFDHGKSVSENLGKGIRKERRKARRQAERAANAVETPMEGLGATGTTAGTSLMSNLIAGIKSFMGTLRERMATVAGIIANLVQPGSPTKEGPLSKEGGIEAWGRELASGLMTGIAAGSRFDVVEALGLNSIDPIPAAVRTAQAHGPMLGNMPSGNTTINLETTGLPMRARTPLEVVQQVRRAARLGTLAPDRRAEFARS